MKKTKIVRKISPFPSPQTFIRRQCPHSSEVYSSIQPKKRRKDCMRRRFSHNKKRPNYFSESPVRRNLRIKQSIEQSIRSHIDRLSDYRHDSFLKRDLPVLNVGNSGCYPVGSSSSPCTLATISKVSTQKKKSNKSISKSVLAKKRRRRINEKLIRINDLENDIEGYCIDSEIKKVTESVQHFDKLRKEFLMGLEKVWAQVSNLRLPKSAGDVSKQIFSAVNKSKSATSSTHSAIDTKLNKNLAPMSNNFQKVSSKQFVKTKNTGVLDNLSKMLMNLQL